jgi:Fe-S oxidoreductase
MGWLPVTLRIARSAPRLANLLLAVPGAQALARRLGGIDRHRALPRIATDRRLRSSLVNASSQSRRNGPAGDPVLLWVDTFTSSFAPEIARSAVQVLEHAGYRVELAPRGVCCGLTWTSTGQLGVARRVLSRTIRLLDRTSERMPIVALEPSCAAALRHDARNLLAGEDVVRVAGRVRSLAELLVDRPLPLSKRDPVTAVAQFHCHQRATTGTDADKVVLAAAGVEVAAAPEGCCGLAGNFGFEDGHYDVSVSCAEEALLPAIRAHEGSGPVVADGFSCRIQVEQLASRRALHLAEVLADRLPPGDTGQGSDR